MASRTIVITGASDGIGAVAARTLAGQGEHVVIVGRSPQKTAAVAKEAGVDYLVADFSRLDDVRTLAEDLKNRLDGRIDVLANNAGGIFGDRVLTTDGFEYTFQVNHLAPFLLTNLLLEELRAGEGTVVNTASIASRIYAKFDINDLQNEREYTQNRAYGDSKLANILFTKSLHEQFHDRGINAVALHPGNVATNFAADSTTGARMLYQTPLKRLFLISAGKGGANLTWAIDGTPGDTWEPGEYYDQRKLATRVNPMQNDSGLARELWAKSAEMTGIPAY